MTQISQRINQMAASATLAMSQRSNELRAKGVDVINLSVGEPDFDTPQFIKDAACKAIADNFSRYTPVPGYMSLRQAIADNIKEVEGVSFLPEQIVVGNGAKQELFNVIMATINPGDEVVLPTPAWVSYVEMIKLAQGKVIEVPAAIDQDFKITPAQLRAALTPATVQTISLTENRLVLNVLCTGTLKVWIEKAGKQELRSISINTPQKIVIEK